MSDHVTDEQLSLLIDGELSLTARAAITSHLNTCPSCAERHDALVGVAVSLRLTGPARWRPAFTAGVLERLAPRRRIDVALPISASFAIAAVALAAFHLTVVTAGLAFAGSMFEGLGQFVPSVVSARPAGTLASLVTIALFGPLLSLRLARWR